jgi:Lon protease-like protein
VQLLLTVALLATLSQHPPPARAVDLRAANSSPVATDVQTATPIALPSQIPLFPLPEVVLFPGVRRPLVIYEPRYREMLADALKGDRIIGTVLLRPGFEANYEGRPPIYAIGCAGVIEDYQELPDGRYAILLRGLTTFRVVSEDQQKPYRLARVEAIPELLPDNEREPLSTLRERLAELLIAVLPPDVEPPDPDLEDDEFINITAQALSMPESVRQGLLERNSVLARARALVERLAN